MYLVLSITGSKWCRRAKKRVNSQFPVMHLKTEILTCRLIWILLNRESDMWHWEEQAQHQEDNSRSRSGHKGRNNNNNNTQEKVLSLWDTDYSAMCDNMQACRWDVGWPTLKRLKKGRSCFFKMSLKTCRVAETTTSCPFPPQMSSAVRL